MEILEILLTENRKSLLYETSLPEKYVEELIDLFDIADGHLSNIITYSSEKNDFLRNLGNNPTFQLSDISKYFNELSKITSKVTYQQLDNESQTYHSVFILALAELNWFGKVDSVMADEAYATAILRVSQELKSKTVDFSIISEISRGISIAQALEIHQQNLTYFSILRAREVGEPSQQRKEINAVINKMKPEILKIISDFIKNSKQLEPSLEALVRSTFSSIIKSAQSSLTNISDYDTLIQREETTKKALKEWLINLKTQ
ncbi:hypothetical protein [Microbulbifer variabilis]|uniref:hypothetical protein n=1 Tax=Microbulbifer variabilis TaxID=266805 RepID=UPI001CFC8D7B|nr:hypothetical protein [Microbulbifer variabilis]